jgi:hypothetical protein
MVFTHEHINAYVIVGGDSDFLSLVEKLKQYDKKVFVVGGRAFTSVILQRNCHEFIAYENLNRSRRPAAVRSDRPVVAAAVAPISQAFPIVRRALKILSDREVSPQTGLLKSTLLQLDSTFSERNYGASSFLDFAEKLAQSGLVQLKHAGRSVMVELNSGFSGDGETVEAPHPVDVAQPARPHDAHVEPPSGPQIGTQAEGVKLAGQIIKNATTARWPMYVRNVKQLLRAHRNEGGAEGNGDGASGGSTGSSGGFDERQYGFGGLMDLLRACQKEGFLRVERDRRGGLRVFPGQALQRTDAPPPLAHHEADLDVAATEAAPAAEMEPAPEPIPVDTTAELLGRASAKPRRTRQVSSRVGAASAPRAVRKTAAARKPATRRAPRAAKAPRPDASSDSDE